MAHHCDDFMRTGASVFKAAVKPCLAELEMALRGVPRDHAGVRIHGVESLNALLGTDGCVGEVASTVLGQSAQPVRAIFFNKSSASNWSLGWHQDRTICVKQRVEVSGFGPWTVKRGMIHVAPPFDLLTRMVTLRVHFDDVPDSNAPLLIAPGSHSLGRIAVAEVPEVVSGCGTQVCTATAGDIWVYATPILHASPAASAATRRRVLHVDFAAEALPNGLEWLGV